jgi:hypothetical protein
MFQSLRMTQNCLPLLIRGEFDNNDIRVAIIVILADFADAVVAFIHHAGADRHHGRYGDYADYAKQRFERRTHIRLLGSFALGVGASDLAFEKRDDERKTGGHPRAGHTPRSGAAAILL